MTFSSVQTLQDFSYQDLEALAQSLTVPPPAPGQAPPRPVTQVSTAWLEQQRCLTCLRPLSSEERFFPEEFSLVIDGAAAPHRAEPTAQEVMLAALNAFIVQAFTSDCLRQGIRLERVEVSSNGYLDLKAFITKTPRSQPDPGNINWTLTVQGDATPEKFQQIFARVFDNTPSAWSLVVMF